LRKESSTATLFSFIYEYVDYGYYAIFVLLTFCMLIGNYINVKY